MVDITLDEMKANFFALLILSIGIANSVVAQELRLEGRFEHRTDEESRDMFGDQVCFFPDRLTAGQLPRETVDRPLAWFCFTNTVEAERKLRIPAPASAKSCGYAGTAVVTVNGYQVYRGEGDGNDLAVLRSVASVCKGETIRCMQ